MPKSISQEEARKRFNQKVKPGPGFDESGRQLAPEELNARQALIKQSLDRTKNVSPNQLAADDILGATPAELKARASLAEQIATTNVQEIQNLNKLREGDLGAVGIQTGQPQVPTRTVVDEQGNVQEIPVLPGAAGDNAAAANAQNAALAGGATVAAAALGGGVIGGGIAAVAPSLATSVPTAVAAGAKIGGWTKLVLGGVAGYSASKFLNSFTSGRQASLTSDITDLTASTRSVAVLAPDNPDLALQTLEGVEGDMIELLGQLHLAYQQDPLARLSGKDIEEFAFRNLLVIQARKQAVRKYKLTGDRNSLLTEVGLAEQSGPINQ